MTPKAREERHGLDPLRYVEPATVAKILGGLAIWASSLFAVQHKAAVETAQATDQAEASAALAVYAAEQADSLLNEVQRLKREVRLLKLAIPETRLALARKAAARGTTWKPRSHRQPSLWSKLKFW